MTNPKYRSISNLGDFDDSTKNTEKSKTDPSQYESIESLLKRCLRGENMNSQTGTFDKPIEGQDPFDNQPIQEQDGFDLADVAAANAIVENAAVSGDLKVQSTPQEPAPEPSNVTKPITDPIIPKSPEITE